MENNNPPPHPSSRPYNKQILKGVKIRSNNPLDKSCLEPKPGYTVSTSFYRTARTKSKFSIPTGNNLIRHFHATHNIQLVTSRRSKKSKRKKRERKGGRGGKRNGLYTQFHLPSPAALTRNELSHFHWKQSHSPTHTFLPIRTHTRYIYSYSFLPRAFLRFRGKEQEKRRGGGGENDGCT